MMGLPSIVEVAEKHGLTVDSKTLNHKEVRAVCPFCDNTHKHHLSLNQKDNVYKCWCCQASGGVLKFEANLTGKSFAEVKEQYFQPSKANVRHPVQQLSMEQLDVIGYGDVKRMSYKTFMHMKEGIYHKWNVHVFKTRQRAFARLVVGMETDEYETAIRLIDRQAQNMQVPTLVQDVLSEYSKLTWEAEWAIRGEKMAEVAIRAHYRPVVDIQRQINLFIDQHPYADIEDVQAMTKQIMDQAEIGSHTAFRYLVFLEHGVHQIKTDRKSAPNKTEHKASQQVACAT